MIQRLVTVSAARLKRGGAVSSVLLLAAVTATSAAGSDAPRRADFSGTWQLNEELSENPREKMRQAMGSRGRGGFSGGRGGFGGGRGGFGGPGGGRGPGGASREDMKEGTRAVEESYQVLEISHQEPEMRVRYGEEREEVIYTDGRAFERIAGRGEPAEATAGWKGEERILVRAEGERGKVIETWEWVPDARQLWLTVKVSGAGRMPGFEYRRVYDPVTADEQLAGQEDAEAASGSEELDAEQTADYIHMWH